VRFKPGLGLGKLAQFEAIFYSLQAFIYLMKHCVERVDVILVRVQRKS
jgi:hypothetical protein